jgi:hypothetical protein
MEYFKGLFFLTTNRIGHIDDAFLSRVNIVIGYDPLNDEKRNQIWNGFFAKLQSDMENRKKEGKTPIIQVDKYAKKYLLNDEAVKALKWNGREVQFCPDTVRFLVCVFNQGRIDSQCFSNGDITCAL